MSDVGIASLTAKCIQLKTINIRCCSRLTDASLAAIGATCKGLTSIDMSYNDMTDIGIATLTQGCSELKIIHIAYCSQLTDASLAAIGETCKGLTSDDVYCACKITDIGMASLTQGCSGLRIINPKDCSHLRDA